MGYEYAQHCKLLRNLHLLSHRVNEILRFMDPHHYEMVAALRKFVEDTYAFAQTLGSLDPLLYEGHKILPNVMSDEHTDRHDPELSWAIIAALGSHKGGYIYIKHLALRIRLEPGDIVMLRGRVLKHKVEPWTGGQRISIPHFTHSSVWRMAQMEHLVGGEADGPDYA